MVAHPSSGGEGKRREPKFTSFAGWLAHLQKRKSIGRFPVPSNIERLPCGCEKPEFAPAEMASGPQTRSEIIAAVRSRLKERRPLVIERCWHEYPFKCGICGSELQ